MTSFKVWSVLCLFLCAAHALEIEPIEIWGQYNGLKREGYATMSHTCNQVRAPPAELGLPQHMRPVVDLTFYTKYTEVYGIPILSSAQVDDQALMRLCYMIRFALATHSRVRESVYSWFGRFVVSSRDHVIRDIPEYSSVSEENTYQNVGGSYYNPVTVVSELNLLCHSDARYKIEDVGLHEVAHMLRNGGARWAIPGWEDKLSAAYDSAMAAGLWNNTYATTSSSEYFARMVTIYYDVTVHNEVANGNHGPISNRTLLKDHDRVVYDLVEDIFPCDNAYISRCLKDRDAENAQVLQMNCDIRKPFTSKCYNKSWWCPKYKEQGHCATEYYQAKCPYECGLCQE